ncbi:MAG TPA: hypothetical protein VFC19_47860 [Candidatus Limnocylindrales bacterium]|nr:hypothetical protein [Candidatus Limnocylindrales bacterium]
MGLVTDRWPAVLRLVVPLLDMIIVRHPQTYPDRAGIADEGRLPPVHGGDCVGVADRMIVRLAVTLT